MLRSKGLVASLFAGSLLSACGGGGGGGNEDISAAPAPVATPAPSPTPAPAPAPVSKAEGAYEGTVEGNQAFQGLILSDDQFWSLYGTISGSTFLVTGFVQGQGRSNNGTYTVDDLRDFAFSPAVAGTMNATYVPGATLNGTLTSPSGSQTFAGTAMAPADYNFNTPAAVASIAGSWTMDVLNGTSATLSISASGAYTGISSEQCRFSGTFSPHSSGKNVFALTVAFGGAPCVNDQPYAGIAVTSLVNGGPTRQLLMLGSNSARTEGAGLIGTR